VRCVAVSISLCHPMARFSHRCHQLLLRSAAGGCCSAASARAAACGIARAGDGFVSALKYDQQRCTQRHCIEKPMSAKCSFQSCTGWVFEKGLCRMHMLVPHDAAADTAPPPPPPPPLSSSSLKTPPVDEAALTRSAATAPCHRAHYSLFSSVKPPMPSI
jgi:hypothetical protein